MARISSNERLSRLTRQPRMEAQNGAVLKIVF